MWVAWLTENMKSLNSGGPLYTFQHSSKILNQCLAQSWPKVSIMVKVWVAKLGVGADESI